MDGLRRLHIPIPGAILVLIAFFLPWMSVSCMGVTVDASGMDLARGIPDLDLGGSLLLWLIPLVAVISLVIAVLTMRDDSIEGSTGIGHIILGLLGLGVLIAQWFSLQGTLGGVSEGLDALTDGLMDSLVNVEIGVWITVAGLLIMLIGGVLSYLSARNAAPSFQSPSFDQSTMIQAAETPVYWSDPPVLNAPLDMPYSPPSSPTMEMGQQPGAGMSDPFSQPSHSPKTEVLQRAPEAMAWLVITEGNRAGHRFRLMENTTIGRDPSNDIVLDDTALSSQHARVKIEEDDKFYLWDLASTNGVFVLDTKDNSWQKIHHHELQEGDKVKIGRTVLHFMEISDKAKPAKDETSN